MEVAEYRKLTLEDYIKALVIVESLAELNAYEWPTRGEALVDFAREFLAKLQTTN